MVQHLLGRDPVRLTSAVTFLVGENGSGKSTLLEALAVAMRFSPEGGSRNMNFAATSSVSDLHHWLRITRSANPRDGYFLRAESMYNAYSYLRQINRANDLDYHARSHGEGTMELIRNRFHGGGLFLLDEPESGLSFDTSLEMAETIGKLADKGAQFIIATHSPILLSTPGAQIVQITEEGLDDVRFQECELVQAYLEFLSDPHGTAQFLISDED